MQILDLGPGKKEERGILYCFSTSYYRNTLLKSLPQLPRAILALTCPNHLAINNSSSHIGALLQARNEAQCFEFLDPIYRLVN